MRIVRKRWKFVYIVGGYAALWGIARVTENLPVPIYVGLDYILWFVYIMVAVRSFRGRDEPLEPPRPWWRMTARPAAGFNLGALFVLAAFLFALPQLTASFGGYAIGYALVFGAFALLYFHSSFQLNKRGTAQIEASSAE